MRCDLPAVFLCALLLGLMVCWWWRVELRPPRTLQLQTVLHKESQDPLLHGAPLAPHTGTVKVRPAQSVCVCVCVCVCYIRL